MSTQNKHQRAIQTVKGGTKEGLFKAMELAKGLSAESNTLRALEHTKPDWLISARAATPEENKRGIDIILNLNQDISRKPVPLQIKSSEWGLQNHIQKRRELNGRFIPAVVIFFEDSNKKIVEKVKSVLDFYFDSKKKYQRIKKKTLKKKALSARI